MSWFPWRHHVEPDPADMTAAISAINEATSRAQRTKNILEKEAAVSKKLAKERTTNGFAEMISAVISQQGDE